MTFGRRLEQAIYTSLIMKSFQKLELNHLILVYTTLILLDKLELEIDLDIDINKLITSHSVIIRYLINYSC